MRIFLIGLIASSFTAPVYALEDFNPETYEVQLIPRPDFIFDVSGGKALAFLLPSVVKLLKVDYDYVATLEELKLTKDKIALLEEELEQEKLHREALKKLTFLYKAEKNSCEDRVDLFRKKYHKELERPTFSFGSPFMIVTSSLAIGFSAGLLAFLFAKR